MKNRELDYSKRMFIGVQRGVSKALDRHKKLGESVVVLQDGKVVEIKAEDIVVPPYPDDSELDDI